MPLSMMREGEKSRIKKVGGKEETRRFLETRGFVVGGIFHSGKRYGGEYNCECERFPGGHWKEYGK